MVGNHSYSHPYFSQISLEQCLNEIQKTEKLIQASYAQAKIKRPCKIIRLPFADRGAGPLAKQPQNKEEAKYNAIQQFLKAEGFVPIPHIYNQDNGIDALFDWDAQDYKSKNISNNAVYKKNLEASFNRIQSQATTLLLHDFDSNHHLFSLTIEFLLQQNVRFQEFF